LSFLLQLRLSIFELDRLFTWRLVLIRSFRIYERFLFKKVQRNAFAFAWIVGRCGSPNFDAAASIKAPPSLVE
jgi:hypothetical protein